MLLMCKNEVCGQSDFKRFARGTKIGCGVEIVLRAPEVESYNQKVEEFASVISPLRLRLRALNEFRVADPFGSYLRITSIYEVLDSIAPL